MTNLFVNWYSLIRISDRLLVRFKIYAFHEMLVRVLSNTLLPIIYVLTKKSQKYCLKPSVSKPKLIVSLTSFPARIESVHLVVETIFRQTVKPDMIILWLSNEQFDGVDSLSDNLIKQQSRGLTIKFKDGDIRSHKKYYYVLKEFPDANIITVDDDIFYKDTLIADLLRYHKSHPDCIVSHYSKKIVTNNNTLASYK
ncbi:MAG: glycosyl transferase, partial [Rikenellaceae bacterium]